MVLILGLGNLLLRDEGFGVKVIDKLQREYRFAESVSLLDGGTGAFFLLPHLERAERVIIIDVVKLGNPPGSIYELTFEECLLLPQEKLSLHEVSLSDLLFLLQLRGKTFKEFVLIGVEPAIVAVGDNLSEELEEALPEVIKRVLSKLRDWGFDYFPSESSAK